MAPSFTRTMHCRSLEIRVFFVVQLLLDPALSRLYLSGVQLGQYCKLWRSMGVLAIIIRVIRIRAMLFVLARNLVLNVTPGTWGTE